MTDPAVRVLQRAVAAHDEILGRFVPLVEDMHPRLLHVEADVAQLKTDVCQLKTDMAQVKTDVAQLKIDMAYVKSDVAEGKQQMASMTRLLLAIATKVGVTDFDLN